MKLYAIADLHLRYEVTRRALQALRPHPVRLADPGRRRGRDRGAPALRPGDPLPPFRPAPLGAGQPRPVDDPDPAGRSARRGASTERLVEICREFGVLTPEDPYVTWPGDGAAAASWRRSSCSTTTPSGPDEIAQSRRPSSGRRRRTSSARTRCSSTPIPTRRGRPGAGALRRRPSRGWPKPPRGRRW